MSSVGLQWQLRQEEHHHDHRYLRAHEVVAAQAANCTTILLSPNLASVLRPWLRPTYARAHVRECARAHTYLRLDVRFKLPRQDHTLTPTLTCVYPYACALAHSHTHTQTHRDLGLEKTEGKTTLLVQRYFPTIKDPELQFTTGMVGAYYALTFLGWLCRSGPHVRWAMVRIESGVLRSVRQSLLGDPE